MTIPMEAFARELKKQALVGTLLTGPIRDALREYALTRPEGDRTDGVRKKLLDAAEDVQALEGRDARFRRAKGQKQIHIRKRESPAVVAHELGHAEIDDSRLGQLAQSPLGRSLPVTVGGTFGAVAMSKGQLASGAGSIAAGWAPILAQEGLASIKGIRLLREAGATEEELTDAKKRLLAAWGTYATLPVAMIGDLLTIKAVIGGLTRAGQ